MNTRKRLTGIALLVACLTLAGFSGKEPVYVNFTIEPLAPGVWAALNTKHGICNAGIIDLGDKTVVFDPFMNLDAAEELKAAALYLTHRSPALDRKSTRLNSSHT